MEKEVREWPGLMTPKYEGMRIPKKIIELYGCGVGVEYPQEDFKKYYLEEFGEEYV